MQIPGIYEISCSYGKSNTEQIEKAIEIRIKYHENDVNYKRTQKSTVTEHKYWTNIT